jgi:hypothetical protein
LVRMWQPIRNDLVKQQNSANISTLNFQLS